VRAVLADDSTYLSSNAIALNDVVNTAMQGGTIASDGELHAQFRHIVAHRLTPRALRPIQQSVQQRTEALASHVAELRAFDAVTDLAQALPLSVVPEFVGLPPDARGQMLKWASANFDSLGPLNERGLASLPGCVEMAEYAARTAASGNVVPGTLADGVVQAARRGEITEQQSVRLMLAYIAPSLDTTISAIGCAVWLFARHDDQWQKLRADPTLIPAAISEILRYETPIRALGRRAARPVEFGGVRLDTDDRLLLLYASANRDERQWDRPDEFDITRDSTRQLGFGYGVHGCPGQGLARIEIESLLTALARRVRRFVLTDEPTWTVNNAIRAFDSIPVRVELDGD